MASLTYWNAYPEGQKLSDSFNYSQVVRIPGTNTIKCSGQGGWDPQTGAIDAKDYAGQVELAFKNIDTVLQAAGSRGWEDVYLVRSYHINIDESLSECSKMFKKYCPNHRPVYTAVGVPRLGLPEMQIEIEVEAYIDPASER